MLTLAEVARRFEGARQQGAGWLARCPAHDDGKASLSLSVGDTGRILLHCHAGCTFDAISKAANLATADLSPENGHKSNGKGRIVAEYEYRDEAGVLLYQSLRYEPKGFSQRSPDGNGGWNYSTKGIRKVLYRLPELVAADTEQTVFICEGEKDCDRLAAAGILATTNVGGAEKWLPEYSESLRGRRVVIVPDNDEAGRKHQQCVGRSLQDKADVRLLELAGLPKSGDVSDWLNNGGTVEELIELADNAPAWEPAMSTTVDSQPPEPQTGGLEYQSITLAELENVPDPVYLIPGILEQSQPGVIAGQYKSLKTTLALELSYCLVTGESFLGAFPPTRTARVGMFSGEAGPAQLRGTIRRIAAFHGDHKPWRHDGLILSCERLPKIGSLEYMDALVRWIDKHKLELCIIDPGYAALAAIGDSAGNYYKVADLLFQVTELQRKTGCIFLLCPHMTKAPKYEPPMLSDIQWSGFPEWSGQWLLSGKRREWDDKTGQHWLWFVAGGRSGHADTWGLDVTEGRQSDPGGKVFEVEVIERDRGFAATTDALKAQTERQNSREQEKGMEAIRGAFRSLGAGCHVKAHVFERSGTSGRGRGVQAAWATMLRTGEIKVTEGACKGANNKPCDGYSYHPKDQQR